MQWARKHWWWIVGTAAVLAAVFWPRSGDPTDRPSGFRRPPAMGDCIDSCLTRGGGADCLTECAR